jgi:hypothetical protein
VVQTLLPGSGPPVLTSHEYAAHVTLYIEADGGELTPSGWSTRKADGAARDEPFWFQPGRNLIEGEPQPPEKAAATRAR